MDHVPAVSDDLLDEAYRKGAIRSLWITNNNLMRILSDFPAKNGERLDYEIMREQLTALLENNKERIRNLKP